MSNQITTELTSHIEKRSIILVGKMGVGKSKLLNELLGENFFPTSAALKLKTTEITSIGRLVKFKLEDREISYYLNAIDTPGLADTKDRSKVSLNKIAETIKTTPLNLIIVLVEYGRMDTGATLR